MIVRIDDVSQNTDREDFMKQLSVLQNYFDEIIVGINLFCKKSGNGGIYPEVPLSGHDRLYFYNVDNFLYTNFIEDIRPLNKVYFASHGLIHSEHGQLSRDAVELSIMVSCNFLRCRKFIPPFNNVNDAVKSVCEAQGIELIWNDDNRIWRSLESVPFDCNYKFWYYHPWKLNSSELIKLIGNYEKV